MAAQACEACGALFAVAGVDRGGGLAGELGEVCRRCDAYNEPGTTQCATCGASLGREDAEASVEGLFAQLVAGGSADVPEEELTQTAVPAQEADSQPEPAFDTREAPAEAAVAADFLAPPAEDRAEQLCVSCGAASPPAAKFCSECGERLAPEATPESGAQFAPETTPESEAGAQLAPEPASGPEAVARLVIERGSRAGSSFPLTLPESTLGGAGAQIELADDPYLTPCMAALVVDGGQLFLRDEGAPNGVFVKAREPLPLAPGDIFLAGERVLRYDGPCELPSGERHETAFSGSPRPAGTPVRVSELVAGARAGRTCYRPGPTITVGRTGCDLNFAADPLLAPRHAELRIAEDGAATLVDLGGSASGVLVRLRPHETKELREGDFLQLGQHLLRVAFG